MGEIRPDHPFEHDARCPKSRPAPLRPLDDCECYADILNDQSARFSKTLEEIFSRGPDRPPCTGGRSDDR